MKVKPEKNVDIQSPRLDLLADKSYQQKFSQYMDNYQRFINEGQKISDQSLLTRFNK